MRNLRKILLLAVALVFCNIPFAQSFKIGSIDIYGNRKISSDTILSHLTVDDGDSISYENFKPENIVAALEQVPGVKHATVNPISGGSLYLALYLNLLITMPKPTLLSVSLIMSLAAHSDYIKHFLPRRR
jgi:hypothetical protein